MHWTVRWMRNGKVLVRCRSSVSHRLATIEKGEVTCENCLRLMNRGREV